LKSALGLAEADQDDDGNAAGSKPPLIRPATQTELEVIHKICEDLDKKEGFVVKENNVIAIMIERQRDNILPENIARSAEWIVKAYGDDVLYKEATFEDKYDLGKETK